MVPGMMQAHILYLIRIDFSALVGNFELKTLFWDGELWIKILSQGLGSLTPHSTKYLFLTDQSPHPIP